MKSLFSLKCRYKVIFLINKSLLLLWTPFAPASGSTGDR